MSTAPDVLTRRALLGRSGGALAAAALPAGAAVIVPAIAMAAPASIAPALAPVAAGPEDPELVALGEQIEPLLSTYRAAVDRKRAARSKAEELCPPLPDELVRKAGVDRITFAGATEREVDVEGRLVWENFLHAYPHNPAPREIIQAGLLEEQVLGGRINAPPRSKFGKRVRALLQTARKYEAAREAAIAQSGLRQAIGELGGAAYDLEKVAYEIRKIEPVTMAGVMIQARALVAYGEAETYAGHFDGRSGQVLGRELASALLRLTPGGAARG